MAISDGQPARTVHQRDAAPHRRSRRTILQAAWVLQQPSDLPLDGGGQVGRNLGRRAPNREIRKHNRSSGYPPQEPRYYLERLLRGYGSTTCPLDDAFPYTVRHNPFVYFNGVTDNLDPNSAYCIAHIRPLTELATDLLQGTVARYNFIAPDLCHDMHTACGQNPILEGDTWLAANLPGILSSEAYLTGGAVFITWDEPEELSDRPVGMIVVSPYAKHGYSNWLQYDNSTLLRTVEEIVGIDPVLPDDIGHNADLSDLFAAFP